jgi:hypothetical protein
VSPSTEERKLKADDHSISNEIGRKLACIMKLETDKPKKEKDDSPPPWFKKYMQKVYYYIFNGFVINGEEAVMFYFCNIIVFQGVNYFHFTGVNDSL